MAISVQLQPSCDPECLAKHEGCCLGSSPGFWTECQVARRCQQSLRIPEHFMNYFMRIKLAISVCYLSRNLELEGVFLVVVFFVCFVFVVCLFWVLSGGNYAYFKDNSVLIFLVVTVECESKSCKTIQEVERESRFFSSGVLEDHLKKPWS